MGSISHFYNRYRTTILNFKYEHNLKCKRNHDDRLHYLSVGKMMTGGGGVLEVTNLTHSATELPQHMPYVPRGL
jgi:hypothetical protein